MLVNLDVNYKADEMQTGERVSSVKYLSWKHKELSLISGTHKKTSLCHEVVIPSLGS